MRNKADDHRIALYLFILLVLACLPGILRTQTFGQKREDPLPKTPLPTREPAVLPKRGDPVIEKEERPGTKVIVREVIKEVKVRPNEGALVMWVVQGAEVTVTPIQNNKQGKPFSYDLGQSNKLTLRSLGPGKYQVKVTHPDYNPFTETLVIGKGEVFPLLPSLVSRYGSIIIGGAPQDATVQLDGKVQTPSDYTIDERGQITIPRVLVGGHTLKVSKAGYEDWVSKLEVKPAEPTPAVAEPRLATVKLNVRSSPNARVYLDNVEIGTIPSNGQIVIPNLPPGAHRLYISLDGFEPVEKELALTLDDRTPIVKAELIPVAESEEATVNDNTPGLNWTPDPAGWEFKKGVILVRGDTAGFFKSLNEGRQFNYYRDFTMYLDLSFANGKGAAWILRAKDRQNYYLFELTTSGSESKRKLFNSYICQDGQTKLVNSINVSDDIDNPQANIHIKIEARGNRFSHSLRVSTNPRAQALPLGIFTDKENTFPIGGIGFRGINGKEMFIHGLHIIPEKRK